MSSASSASSPPACSTCSTAGSPASAARKAPSAASSIRWPTSSASASPRRCSSSRSCYRHPEPDRLAHRRLLSALRRAAAGAVQHRRHLQPRHRHAQLLRLSHSRRGRPDLLHHPPHHLALPVRAATDGRLRQVVLAALMVFLSFMMFSKFEYPSFKGFNWRTQFSLPKFMGAVAAPGPEHPLLRVDAGRDLRLLPALRLPPPLPFPRLAPGDRGGRGYSGSACR